MADRKMYVGDAAIGKGIRSLDNVLNNINERISDLAVSIITHAAGPGNGDMSRALDLCKTVARRRTLNVAYLIGYFRHFASTTVNLKGNDGKGKVSLMSKDAKGYRGFDVAGAKVHNWYDAFDDNGKRAPWYSGPEPAEFKPLTVGDLAARMNTFVENTGKMLTGTKEVKGKQVPIVSLTDADEQQVKNALLFITRIAATLARHEEVAKLEAQLADTKGAIEQDNAVVEVLAQPVADKAVA